jgi:hypothetical protein
MRKCLCVASSRDTLLSRIVEVAEMQRLGDAGVDAGRRGFRVDARLQPLAVPASMRSTQKVHLVATEPLLVLARSSSLSSVAA